MNALIVLIVEVMIAYCTYTTTICTYIGLPADQLKAES